MKIIATSEPIKIVKNDACHPRKTPITIKSLMSPKPSPSFFLINAWISAIIYKDIAPRSPKPKSVKSWQNGVGRKWKNVLKIVKIIPIILNGYVIILGRIK